MAKVLPGHERAGKSLRSTYLRLAIATMVAGLFIRFALPELPFWVRKWGGSVLWAMLVYWLVALLLPIRSFFTRAGLTAAVATMVELVRLYHSPGLDAFRKTLAGVLLLGSVFSAWDIVAYWVAISIAVWMDHVLFRRSQL